MAQNKFKFKMVGTDGNAFSLLGRFKREALRNGWEKNEVDKVINECRSGDYDNLIVTLIKYTDAN